MMNNEPELEIVWWTPPFNIKPNDYKKCSEFEECGWLITGGRHGWDRISDKRFCERHCPLGDLYMKKYQPQEYEEFLKRCEERGWAPINPSKI